MDKLMKKITQIYEVIYSFKSIYLKGITRKIIILKLKVRVRK